MAGKRSLNLLGSLAAGFGGTDPIEGLRRFLRYAGGRPKSHLADCAPGAGAAGAGSKAGPCAEAHIPDAR
jgi:hypothetical protein